MSLVNDFKTMLDNFEAKERMPLNDIIGDNVGIIIIDMIKGFAKEGALYSDRIEDIITSQKKVLETYHDDNLIFLCDAHPRDAVEFDLYPPHCEDGTVESEIVEELKGYRHRRVNKLSTNGFLEEDFQKWLQHQTYDDYIVMGCCTDLCVLQFVLTLKAHFNRNNSRNRIIVPMSCVETYDLDVTNHPGNLTHFIALKTMEDSGIILAN